ncbi:MAG: hypothetical protein AAGF20_09115, partial [Pseudomonadota bacterium]
MASTVITTNTTTSTSLTGGDQYFLARGVTNATVGSAIGYTGSGTGAIQITVLGDLYSAISAPILLTGASAVLGGLIITVGIDGSIIGGSNSTAIVTTIDNTVITNAGLIEGQLNLSSSATPVVFNSGTIVQTVGTASAITSFTDGLSLTNAGLVRSNGPAVQVIGNDASIDNSGSILAGNGLAIQVGSNAEIFSNGLISSLGSIAVRVGDDSTLTNHGDIAGEIEGGNVVSINNTGNISSDDRTVEVGQDAVIFNSGTILGGWDGIAIGASQRAVIDNTGVLQAGTGIEVSTGQIRNSGTITANFVGMTIGSNDQD